MLAFVVDVPAFVVVVAEFAAVVVVAEFAVVAVVVVVAVTVALRLEAEFVAPLVAAADQTAAIVPVAFVTHLLLEFGNVQRRLQPHFSIYIFPDYTDLKCHVFPRQTRQFLQGVP